MCMGRLYAQTHTHTRIRVSLSKGAAVCVRVRNEEHSRFTDIQTIIVSVKKSPFKTVFAVHFSARKKFHFIEEEKS